MAVRSLCTRYLRLPAFFISFVYIQYVWAITGSSYQLDAEYSGNNFFDGWDFYTGGDPTGGFVTQVPNLSRLPPLLMIPRHYSRSSAQLTGLINATDGQPAYIGSDYTSLISTTQAAGRPSVRISTKRSWTHGLFIGDFKHSPAGVCGSWPAFWTLGPNWPYNGEIDIMEGVNLVDHNGMTLHTNPNCTIAGDRRLMTGQLQTTNCAYYPGYNVGCGISDNRPSSFGVGFNSIGGGVYAMQWTSEYIRIWFFPRGEIPSDIVNNSPNPNPASWGLPQAHMQGDCVIDQHFQSHKIILNNAFCGEYAGAPSVWNSTVNSCATYTGFSSCSAYVAGVPSDFQASYWQVNSIRVYQLVDSGSGGNGTSTPYIASLQPTQATQIPNSGPAPTPSAALCPTYNFTVVQSGAFKYEIECGVNPGGTDIGRPYPAFVVNSFEDCVAGCSYWNANITSNSCGGVAYQSSNKACYWKRSVTSTPSNSGFNGARLIYYAYPQVTDDPNNQPSSSSTPPFVSTVVTPQTYINPSATTTTSISLISETPAGSFTNGVGKGTTSTSYPVTSTMTTNLIPTSTSSTTSSWLSSTGRTSSYSSVMVSSSSPSSPTQTPPPSPSTSPSSTASSSILISTTITSRSTTFSTQPPFTSVQTEPSTTSTAVNSYSFSNTFFTSTQTPWVFPSPSTTTTSPLTPIPSTSVQQPTTASQSPPNTSTRITSIPITSSTTRVPLPSTTNPITLPSTVQTPPTTALPTSSPVVPPTTHSSSPPVPTTATQMTSARPDSSSTTTRSNLASSTIQFTSTTVLPPPPSTTLVPPFSSASLSISPSSSLSSTFVSTTSQFQHDSSTTTAIVVPTSSIDIIFTTTLPPSPPVSTGSSVVTTTEIATPTPNLPGPPVVDEFRYAGCLGPRPNTAFGNSFIINEISLSMSIDGCVSLCSSRGQQYAAIYATQCYCSSYNDTIPNPETDYIKYPDSACNTTCPGNPSQKCGGIAIVPRPSLSISLALLKEKRQFTTENDGEVIIVTVYNNTLADGEVGSSSSSSTPAGTITSTTSLSFTNGADIGWTSSSTISLSSPLATTGTSSSVSSMSLSSTTSTSASYVINATLDNTTTGININPSSSSSAPTPSTTSIPPPANSNSNTPTILWPTVISTSYTTICPVHPSICPTPTPTCLSTTITLLHCGCTDLPQPSVPMTTTVISCGHGCHAGSEHWEASPPSENHGTQGWSEWSEWHEPAGANDRDVLTTLTIPCTSEIGALQTSVEAWYQASATAATGANAAAGSAGTDDARPYSFPISFPFSGTAGGVSGEASAATTATLTLALTNGSLSSSNGSANSTWSAAGITPSLTAAPGTPAETSRVFGSAAPPPYSLLWNCPIHGVILLVSLAISIGYPL